MIVSTGERDSYTVISRGILFIFILLLNTEFLFPQAAGKLSGLSPGRLYPEEIYLRTDRDLYIAGEPVYFKISCFNRLTNSRSGISRIAYVSLLDPANNQILQIKIPIPGSSGAGWFNLPDSLSSGNYNIATCTQWMRNSSPELYSYKKINVINPFRNIDKIKVPAGNQEIDTVIFFPESGSVIPGAENVIGFMCLDVNMDPVLIRGIITDSNNNLLCPVNSGENGTGLFRINPSEGTRYYLKADYGNNTSRRFELPSPDDSGIGLSVTEDKEKETMTVKIFAGKKALEQNNIYHLIYSPVSYIPFVLDDACKINSEIKITRSAFPAGLGSIILSDGNDHKYAERWIFNDPKPAMDIEVRTDKPVYSSREKVRIEIMTKDKEGKPVNANLLVSAVRRVTMTSATNSPLPDPRISGLPEINQDNNTADGNDRMIFIKNLINQHSTDSLTRKSVYLPEPDGHIISGTMRNTLTGEPLAGENIVLSFVGKTALCRFTKTDIEGRFRFVSSEEGDREIVIQPLSPDIDDYYVDLDNPFPDVFSIRYPLPFSLDTGMLRMINKVVISMQISRIYDTLPQARTGGQKAVIASDFYGKPEITTTMSDFIELTSLREALKEIVPGAVTSVRKGKTVINTISKQNLHIETRDPLVLVDGVPVSDHGKVLAIPGDKISKIDVLNRGYFISGVALNGIIDITTRKGDLSLIEFDKPVFRQEFEALQPQFEFRSPDYSDPVRKNSRIPDFRNTLYWNPDVRSAGDGKAVVEFYTSDDPDDYLILVEGYSSQSQKGKAIVPISVKNVIKPKENN